MSNTQDTTVTSNEHTPLPETQTLLENLKTLLRFVNEGEIYRAPKEALGSLTQAIEFIEKGEPFHPEPHPDSGQGKWKATAVMHALNEEFYRSIVIRVGEHLGIEAYTADDGSVGSSVLALKVPKLVEQLKEAKKQSEHFNGR